MSQFIPSCEYRQQSAIPPQLLGLQPLTFEEAMDEDLEQITGIGKTLLKLCA
jgi:hypothetical protein